MAITPLPEATIRLLGSTQALTTPTSLVKELIDNALDAKATHIDILISPNTIDKIEVRDNGHGIQLADLDALGKRGHTSKLRSFGELKTIGGISLGFRGEALFSAAQLSQVSITTKTEGETVATSVKLKSLGGVESQTRTSHPLGTTISIINFLSNMPVRHQMALKEAPKTLAKVKELLRSYALARPHVRLNLKVAKGAKGSWSFAPRSNGSIREAIPQIIGRDAASQCMQKRFSFLEVVDGQDINMEDQNHEFVVDMFLPKPDGDLSKISYGQHISIDGRPVSHDKGTMKRIVTIFKRYIKGFFSESSEKVKNPFLRLSIRCPVGSYDPNVEPAKDDVIFCNEYLILEKVEQAFKDIYGEPKSLAAASSVQVWSSKLDKFELLLARKPPVPDPGRTSQTSPSFNNQVNENSPSIMEKIVTTHPRDGIVPLTDQKRAWAIDMSEEYNEELEPDLRVNLPARAQELRQTLDTGEGNQSSDPLNPWAIAKLITPVREAVHHSSASRPYEPDGANRHGIRTLPTPQQSSDPVRANSTESSNPIGPSCQSKSDESSGIEASIRLKAGESAKGEEFPQSPCSTSPINRRSSVTSSDEDLFLPEENLPTAPRRNDFISARNVTNSQLVTSSFHLNGPKRRKGINQPFISTINPRANPLGQDGMRQTALTFNSRSSKPASIEKYDDTDLAWAMDFENRKEEATRRRREQLRIARREAESSSRLKEAILPAPPLLTHLSPHKNRYSAAVAALNAGYPPSQQSGPTPPEVCKTTIPDIDPRGYLMRRQKSFPKPGAPKMSRAKSMRLPLERIPDGEQLNNLLLRVPTNTDYLKRMCEEVGKKDFYITHGIQSNELGLNAIEKEDVVKRLRYVVEEWESAIGSEKSLGVEYCFDSLRCSTRY